MAVAVSGNLSISALINDVRTAVSGAGLGAGTRSLTSKFPTVGSPSWDIVPGTAAGQADRAWGDVRTLTSSQTQSLDLATGGNLTDELGAAVVFVTLRAVLLWTAPTNTTTVLLQRPATAIGVPVFNAVSGAMAALSAGGFQCWCDPSVGVTVTAASADIINLVNSGAPTALCGIVLIGTSV